MREGWKYKKLGDYVEVINGLWTGKKEPFVNVAVIRNTNFSKDCRLKLDDVAFIDVEKKQFETRKLKYGDIIIEKSGGSEKQPVGRPVLFDITEGDFSFSNFTATLRIKKAETLSPMFLHKCLFGHYVKGETLKMQSKTTGLHNLDMKAFLRLPIPCLPLSEQQRIVSELDLLTSIIDKQKAQLKELDTLAQSIFYDMFGDPVENEKGWEVKKLEELCSTITKGTTPTSIGYKFEEHGVNFVKVESFTSNDTLDKSKFAFISDECNNAMLRSQLRNNDILICIAGATIGKLSKVDESILPANTNQACAIVRLKDGVSIINSFLYGYFKYSYINAIVGKLKKGVAQPNLSLGQIRDFDIILPPLPLQQAYAAKIEAIEQQKQRISQSISETQKLFDYTMDKYFG